MSMSRRTTQLDRIAEEKKQASIQVKTGSMFGTGANAAVGLTGLEDETSRQLMIANHLLKKGKLSTLRPILPALLAIKGQPYNLKNYFPFEPFFRTRLPRAVLLKTGRQVSKCQWIYTDVLTPAGVKPLYAISIGDEVVSLCDSTTSVSKYTVSRVTKIWDTGLQQCYEIKTVGGRSLKATKEHRLLVMDGDNHLLDYREVHSIYPGDYLIRHVSGQEYPYDKVVSITRCDTLLPTRDVEVEGTHNFLANGLVSHNSTSLAAQGIVFSNSIPHFSTLYVTPLYEMIRRFSHNYVRNFIETSPVKRLLVDAKTAGSVLQREFRNGSKMYFSFAFLDAERTRGVAADANCLDEIQDLNYDFLSVIHETLSGSQWGLRKYAGTPKSLDNTMQKLWVDSSQAEWMIRCMRGGCNHWNVPSINHDLEDMLGPWHRDITITNPGVVCAKCRKPLDPRRDGRWVHAYPERRWKFAGYHVPQQIMPMHYGDPAKWDILLGKYKGHGNTPINVFFNEVCGESYDVGAKLVTETDLINASILPWENDVEQAEKHLNSYLFRILAVDWGGGGGRLSNSNSQKANEQRERTSFTVLSVLGMRPDGKIDVIWGYRSLKTHDHIHEARLILLALRRFKCSHFAHDYNGAGAAREVLIAQSGFPVSNIVAIAYHPSARKNIMNFHPATDDHPRDWYSVDKSRSLQLTCDMIKYGILRFFKYDYKSADNAGLIRDFLSLIEEKISMRLGTDVYVITKNPNGSDDFAQAVNIGAMALCYLSGKWPDIAAANKLIIPQDLLKYCQPASMPDWDDLFL